MRAIEDEAWFQNLTAQDSAEETEYLNESPIYVGLLDDYNASDDRRERQDLRMRIEALHQSRLFSRTIGDKSAPPGAHGLYR